MFPLYIFNTMYYDIIIQMAEDCTYVLLLKMYKMSIIFETIYAHHKTHYFN